MKGEAAILLVLTATVVLPGCGSGVHLRGDAAEDDDDSLPVDGESPDADMVDADRDTSDGEGDALDLGGDGAQGNRIIPHWRHSPGRGA